MKIPPAARLAVVLLVATSLCGCSSDVGSSGASCPGDTLCESEDVGADSRDGSVGDDAAGRDADAEDVGPLADGGGDVTGCTPHQVECAGQCVDPASSVEHCGGCGIRCEDRANAVAVCTGGICLYGCQPGFVDINRDLDRPVSDGCEYACTPSNGGVEVCDGLDNDCDGGTDEALWQTCSLTSGICAGAEVACTAGSFPSCGLAQYGNEYEQDEGSCDGLDNDCDGDTDEGCECVTGSTQSCYTGPVSSRGVGVCNDGIQECVAGAWDRCSGQRLPGDEYCDDNLDTDCDGEIDEGDAVDAATWFADVDGDGYGDPHSTRTSCTQPADHVSGPATDCDDTRVGVNPGMSESCNGRDDNCDGNVDRTVSPFYDSCAWALELTTTSFEPTDVAADATGDLAVTGAFTATANVGGTSLTSVGGDDVFVVGYDSTGNLRWAKRFGDVDSERGQAIAVDGNANVVIAGQFDGTFDIGSTTLTAVSRYDLFVAKLDPAGTVQWARSFDWWGDDGANAVAIDASGNAYVAAKSGKLHKLSPTGALIWSADRADNSIEALAVDSAGNVLGVYSQWDGPDRDAVAEKINPQGSRLWRRFLGGTDHDKGHGVSVDASDNVIVTGDWGGGDQSNHLDGKAFLAKLDPAGGVTWTEYLDGTAHEAGYDVVVDSAGSLFVAGVYGMTSSHPLVPSDAFVAIFDASGTHLRHQVFGAWNADCMAATGAGTVALVGEHDGFQFSGVSLNDSGRYLLHLEP